MKHFAMKHFALRPIINIILTSSLFSMTTHAFAAGFQLWEQDAATMGNYHAGYAAEANDASTTWYNPAGITRIHNQQIIVGMLAVDTDFNYKGNVSVTEFIPNVETNSFTPITATMNNVKANGGVWGYIPNLEYVAPINENIGFGFSVVVPFGLMTDYGSESALRYLATRTSISVIDISPALGFKLTEKASFGIGLDIQVAEAEFNNWAGLIDFNELTIIADEDTRSKSRANDTGYGYHLGVLYEFTPKSRVGLSYHSQVAHHFTGKSKFIGPIAGLANGDEAESSIVSRQAKANVMLPPYAVLSGYHQFNPCWAVMGSIGYVGWHVFENLRLQNVAGVVNSFETVIEPSTTITVSVPQHYQDTWNASIGANFSPNDQYIFRLGIGYDQSPARNTYRNVQLPDADRYILAFGGHYQATKTIGLDVSYLHVFFNDVKINPTPLAMGAEVVNSNGKVSGNANLFAAQIVWDIV